MDELDVQQQIEEREINKQMKFCKARVLVRKCSKCGREIPTNIFEKEYICCDCRRE